MGDEFSPFLYGKALPAGYEYKEDFLSALHLWIWKKPESGVSGAAPRPAAASAHVPLAAGTQLPDPVQCAQGSGILFFSPPAGEALAPPFLKSVY